MANKICVLILFICLCTYSSQGQGESRLKEYEIEYKTYLFSDPNPLPLFGKIYPYYRYDGYTRKARHVAWKVVELENDYLRIKIFPQIGGKIWSVYDKVAKRELFYDNDVVKFRDISLRGPWTSGGIEFNYGVVGHSPSCSFPVNYLTRKNPDGSVSCFIGVLDLLTRSRWWVEINLPKDKGWFTTSSFWHNSTDGFQPYYNWVNAGVTAKNDLNFIYPGTHVIRHDGITFPWPMDEERNKNLAVWSENNFVGSKSYHITGNYSLYFGTFWAKDNFGMIHYAERDAKVGRKIFSWALSDEGKIWEELLTDQRGQYVELQSGRLFNQNMVQSSLTPYKQVQFDPYATDVWTEYWFPYKDTDGVSEVSLSGVVHIQEKSDTLFLKFSPLQNICDTFCFYDSKGLLFSEKSVNLSVAKTYSTYVIVPNGCKINRVTLAGQDIWNTAEKQLHRPVKTVPDFNWDTAYGNYLKGRDLKGLRLYDQAEVHIKRSLEYDANYLPALTEMAALYYYRMEYDSAYRYAKKALSIDQYDAKANYEYARAARQLGFLYDALDGFELVALTVPLRSAAYTELSRLYLKCKVYDKSLKYAEKSLVNNAFNLSGLQLLYLGNIGKGRKQEAQKVLEQIEKIDPLSHFVRFEKYYSDKTPFFKTAFLDNMKSELSVQEVLELVVMYHSLGMNERSKCLLSLYPYPNVEMRYWQAYLCRETEDAKHYLKLAQSSSLDFVFPFREESKAVYEWALSMEQNWKTQYLLALLHMSRNNRKKAIRLLSNVQTSDYSPFYSLRASLTNAKKPKETDLIRAVQLSPDSWRSCHQLTQFYLANQDYTNALNVIEPFYSKHKDHFPTGSLYVRVLMGNEKYEHAEHVLSHTYILPFEGKRDGRLLYQEIKQVLAIQALKKGELKKVVKKVSEALCWPRNIGIGKPYEDVIDTRMEEWLMALCLMKDGKQTQANNHLQKVAYSKFSNSSINALLQALALYKLNEKEKSKRVYEDWARSQKEDNRKAWGKTFYEKNKKKDFPFDEENLTKMAKLISGTKDVRLF